MMQVELLPAFADNYIFLIREGVEAAVIDPGDADVVLSHLEKNRLDLKTILLTHHHWDHVGGVERLVAATGAEVVGAKKDVGRLPRLERAVEEGEKGCCLGKEYEVLEVYGHTSGHLAYFFATEKAVFVGDTLFNHGCGRMFEGTPQEFWASLKKLRSLPDDTLVYCAHEYTLDNLRFACHFEPENQMLSERMVFYTGLRQRAVATVPTTMAEQKRTNPFLRCDEKNIMKRFASSDPAQVFARIRSAKDHF